MSEHNQQAISVTILDKSYRIACQEQDVEALYRAAQFLDRQMKNIQRSGSIVGSERVAVMAGLNIASEFLSVKEEQSKKIEEMASVIGKLQENIDKALASSDQLELPEVEK